MRQTQAVRLHHPRSHGLFPVSLGKGHFKWEERCVQRPGGLMWLVSLRNSRKASALEQSEWGVSRRGEG